MEARSVSKQFLLRHNASTELKVRFLGFLHPEKRQSIEEFWALRNVSVSIAPGETLGLVGRNGSGKSTFLKLIAGVHRPTTGRLLVARGARISSMIELGVGFHPELTGRENVFLSASIHGLTGPHIERIYRDVVEYSGLEHFIDVPIKNYSSGMHMRLGFAIAANLDPDILLLDEIFAVGDADFQQRCIGTVNRLKDDGKTIIFVSHAASSIRAICKRVCVLEQGELVYNGAMEDGLAFYQDLLTRRAVQSRTATQGTVSADPTAPDGLDAAPHRQALGTSWRDTGLWQFEFLLKEGLSPEHRVLDVGCGSLASAVHLIPFLSEHHYWGIDRDPILLEAAIQAELPRLGINPARAQFVADEAFDLSQTPGVFDFAIATSAFERLPFNRVARCIAGVVRSLPPSGRFYVTFFENPASGTFDPITHPSGITTYPDQEPYHYPLELVALVCDAVGAAIHRIADVSHPRGESVFVIYRRTSDD